MIELKSVKDIIIFKKNYFLVIFFLFLCLSLMQCYIFYLATQEFGMKISLVDAFYIYLSSIILSTLLMVNFFGLFEITLILSASFITKEFFDAIYLGFGLRTLNIMSIILWISLFSSIHFILSNILKKK